MIDRFLNAGFILYPRHQLNGKCFLFNKVIGSVPDVTYKDNTNKTLLKTFGKYPSIFYVGETLYKTFSLSTVFTADMEFYSFTSSTGDEGDPSHPPEYQFPLWQEGVNYQYGDMVTVPGDGYYTCNTPHISDASNHPSMLLGNWTYTSGIVLGGGGGGGGSVTITENIDVIDKTAYDNYMEFKRLVDQHLEWCIRGSIDGESFVCDVEISSTTYNQNSVIKKGGVRGDRKSCGTNDMGMNGKWNSYTGGDIFIADYIQVTIECTEIDTFIYPDDDVTVIPDCEIDDRFEKGAGY